MRSHINCFVASIRVLRGTARTGYCALAAVVVLGCAQSHDQRRLAYYIEDGRAHQNEAEELIQDDAAAQRVAVANPDGRWDIRPSVDSLDRDTPWFCPGEYNAFFKRWSTDPDPPEFTINVRVRRVRREESLDEYKQRLNPPPSEATDDRIPLCLDGKTPIALDPSVASAR